MNLHLGPLAMLLAQIVVILVVSRAVGVVFRRLGQPLVVAEIVAGILLGPSLLGAVWPEGMEALFPATGMAWLQGVSQLGLVLFMFTVGLEFEPGLVRNRGTLAVAISQYSILAPLLAGTALALWLYPRFATDDVAFTGFALFMGASMAVTAFPVLARILAESGMSRTRVGALALTCAAANDVTAWCLLAFVIAVVRAGDLVHGLQTTLLAGAFIAVMVAAVRPFLARVARRFGTEETLGQAAVAAFLVVLLVSSLVSEIIGIHALFGAFLFGAIVPREGPVVRVLTEKVEDLVVILLLPTFFAFTGLRTRIGLVDTPELWAITGFVILVATLGKFVGTAIPARMGGLGTRDSLTLGTLMNTRGLMELIILNIGRDLGVLSPVLFTMMVLMAVVTTLVTSPVVRWLYPPSRALAETLPALPATNAAVPRVLACASHPDTAEGLGHLVRDLCQDPAQPVSVLQLSPLSAQASLFPVHAAVEGAEGVPPSATPPPPVADTLPTDEAAAGDDEADAASILVAASGLPDARLQVHRFESGDPARDICALASREGARLILLGLHRPLVGTARLGGPLVAIAHGADCDIAMVHDTGFTRARRVLLALGTPHDAATSRVGDLLRAAGASFETFRPSNAGDAVNELAARADGFDLVIAGAGTTYGLRIASFELRDFEVFRILGPSLLVVHDASV
jgi:Kef-type K+ transport system membrane component KefB